jgi:hypothetical protein
VLARARSDPRNTARETPKTECVQGSPTPVAGGEGGGFTGVAVMVSTMACCRGWSKLR